jgi:hypothetical protein
MGGQTARRLRIWFTPETTCTPDGRSGSRAARERLTSRPICITSACLDLWVAQQRGAASAAAGRTQAAANLLRRPSAQIQLGHRASTAEAPVRHVPEPHGRLAATPAQPDRLASRLAREVQSGSVFLFELGGGISVGVIVAEWCRHSKAREALISRLCIRFGLSV